MRTVKSLAMEPLQSRVWDDRSAQSVSMRFSVEKISAAAQSVTGLLEKLMSVAIIGLGALDVFNGEMTVGALVPSTCSPAAYRDRLCRWSRWCTNTKRSRWR